MWRIQGYSTEWHECELESDDLKNYKAKAVFYIRRHQDEAAIAKPNSKVPLSAEGVKALERILWRIVEGFTDTSVWLGIRNIIDKINANATA